MTQQLDASDYILLGTQKRDGSVVDTPVWFAGSAGSYIVFSAAKAGKIKRLRNFAEVRIAPCTAIGKPLGDFINGHAYIIQEPREIASAHRCLLKKFGWQMRMADWGAKLTGKYHQRAFIKITTS